ncbi:MAG: hypothetical protein RIS94_2148 [Pseudomonadota bacterium]|jgi:glycosyltransferase involved in cell wall biosynthesis
MPHGDRTSAPEIVINGRFLMQPVTGVQRVARELVRAMDRLAAENPARARLRLVCEQGADLADLDLRVTAVERAGGPGGHLWEQVVLPRHLRGGHLLCLGNTAPIAALASGVAVTVLIHDLSYRQFPRAYRWHYRLGHRIMLPFLLRRARTILTVSETEKGVLGGLRPAALPRIRVARNGGWRDGAVERRPAPPPMDGAASGYVLYVGSLNARKNVHGVLATAIRLAREDGIGTLLVGAGSEILTPVAARIPADLRHLVRLVGAVTDLDQLAEIYRGAACLLFPSYYEASPLPPVEAMSFGCPVIVSAIPAMTERCGRAAVYCNPGSVDEMVAAVRATVRDPARIADRIEQGYAAAERWTWRSQAQAVFSALLDGAPANQARPAHDLGEGAIRTAREQTAATSL